MKRSPSPYSPGPVLKKRAEAVARAALARAANAFRTFASNIAALLMFGSSKFCRLHGLLRKNCGEMPAHRRDRRALALARRVL